MIVNKKVDTKLAVAISIFPKRAPGGSGSSRVSSSASQSAAAARVLTQALCKCFSQKKIIHSLIMHFFQIIGTIYYHSRTRLFPLTPHRRRICRPLVNFFYNSFASKCTKRAAIKNAMVVLGRILQNEVAAMCSDNFESILRLKIKDSVKDINHILS